MKKKVCMWIKDLVNVFARVIALVQTLAKVSVIMKDQKLFSLVHQSKLK